MNVQWNLILVIDDKGQEWYTGEREERPCEKLQKKDARADNEYTYCLATGV
jgi:hypothetical protein